MTSEPGSPSAAEPSSPAAGGAALRLAGWLGPPLLLVAGALLAWWTWGTWPDVLVDFGRELYAPWRLSEGAVLHRDLAWFNGPLSVHFNALLFELFGVSLATLAWANLALLALAVALLYRLLLAVSDPVAATAACLVLLAVFGFGQLVGIGNYNWVAPYSHEVTHGVLLALGSLATLHAWGGRRRLGWVALTGLLLGACFLTKVEPFLAAAAATLLLLSLQIAGEPAARARGRRATAAFVGGAALPPLLAFALLARDLPAGTALEATLGAWPSVLGGEAQELLFYRAGMGLDRPGERLGEMLRWAGAWLVPLAPAAALAFAVRPRTAAARGVALTAFALELAALLALFDERVWLRAARPLPLFTLLLALGFAVRLARRRDRGRQARLELALCVLALALLAKMLLHARFEHYGFALAAPATALVVVALVGWVPALLERRGAAGGVFRAAALGVLLVGCVQILRISAARLELKAFRVGQAGDAFRADVRGEYVNEALREVARLLPDGGTLAVLPEGVTLNYLARLANPTPYVNFMPPELLLFGERAMLDAFEAAPPDAVVLVHKDTSEYGYPLFGRDYGGSLLSWIRSRYRLVRRIGQPPLQPGTTFGIEVLARE